MKKHAPVFFLFILATIQLNAQIEKKMQNISDAVKSSAMSYQTETEEYSSLYCGKVEERLPYSVEIPYLRPLEVEKKIAQYSDFTYQPENKLAYTKGELFYDGIFYDNVTMRLDLYRNNLVILTPDRINNIILDPFKVNYANIADYQIIYLMSDGSKKHPGKGYYMKLYDGENTIFKKYEYDLLISSDQRYYFNYTTKYYLYKDGLFHVLKNKKSLLNLFKDKKKVLEQYIKENNIDFDGFNKGDAFVLVTEQYEKLNKQ